MSPTAKYTAGIVLTHLLVTIIHGLAHRNLHVGITALIAIFVNVVVLISSLLAMVLVWTVKNDSDLFSCRSPCSGRYCSVCIIIFFWR